MRTDHCLGNVTGVESHPDRQLLKKGRTMKVLCVKCEFNIEKKNWEYVFVSLSSDSVWVNGEMRVSAEKPDWYKVGETYECKVEM